MCMDACEEWVQGYFHLMTTGKFGFVGFESLCHDSMSDHFYCGWFANWDYDSSITAWSSLSSLVLFQAVQWLHWCGALPNAMRPMDIGWRKGLRLSAFIDWQFYAKVRRISCCPLAGSMLSHQFFLVQVRSHLIPKFGIWSYMKSTEIKSAQAIWLMRFYDSSRPHCFYLEKLARARHRN